MAPTEGGGGGEESQHRREEKRRKRQRTLRIPPVLLNPRLPREPNSTRPLNRRSRRLLSDNRRIPLRHRGLLGEVLSLLLEAGGVVGQEAGGFDLGGDLGELELHALELWKGKRRVRGTKTAARKRRRKRVSRRYVPRKMDRRRRGMTTDLSDRLSKLHPVEGVRNRLVESALSQSDHLSSDTDATFVQDLDGVPARVRETRVS
jgi:hypothetical protein